MTATNNPVYEYTDEASIYPDLMCVICSEPFRDPVYTPCDHTFCRDCIRHWIENEDFSCPICRKALITMQLKQASCTIRNMLDRIQVKCTACGQTGLRRGIFYHHLIDECPKSQVNCSTVSINCPWVGQRDELESHLKTCVFYLIEPFFNVITNDNEGLKEELSDLETMHTENSFNHSSELQDIHKFCEESIAKLDQRLITNENQIENQEFQLVDYPIQISNSFDRLKQVELNHQDDNNHILQCDQHEMDLKQLTITLNLLKELFNDHQNPELEECIRKRESNSWIDLSRQQLTDWDMEIIIEQAIVSKQCRELDLRRNQLRADGMGMLADELAKNQSLETLYLSFNSIADMGVSYLADSMSFHQTALKKLELDSNEITDQGAACLSEMLKTNQVLTWLSLDNNHITNQGVKSIAHVLTYSNRSLEELYLNGNKSIDDHSVNSLITMIKQQRNMTKLSLENCGITKRGRIRLEQASKNEKRFSLIV